MRRMRSEESDGARSEAEASGDAQPPAATFTTALQSLFNVRSYLDAAGCENYEHFYRLTDQLYAVSAGVTLQSSP